MTMYLPFAKDERSGVRCLMEDPVKAIVIRPADATTRVRAIRSVVCSCVLCRGLIEGGGPTITLASSEWIFGRSPGGVLSQFEVDRRIDGR